MMGFKPELTPATGRNLAKKKKRGNKISGLQNVGHLCWGD